MAAQLRKLNYQARGAGKRQGSWRVVGAVAVDITRTHRPHAVQDDGFDGGTLQGNSYLPLPRDFDEIDSRPTFVGYRFRKELYEHERLSGCENLTHHLNAGHEKKERYTVTYNQNFREQGMSAYFSYNYRAPSGTAPTVSNYNLSLSPVLT